MKEDLTQRCKDALASVNKQSPFVKKMRADCAAFILGKPDQMNDIYATGYSQVESDFNHQDDINVSLPADNTLLAHLSSLTYVKGKPKAEVNPWIERVMDFTPRFR